MARIDENNNFIYESEVRYNKKGFLIGRYIDSNENFIDEKIERYNDAGLMTEEQYDENQDSRYEKIVLYYPEGSRLSLLDTNIDGIYDVLITEGAAGKAGRFTLPDLIKMK